MEPARDSEAVLRELNQKENIPAEIRAWLTFVIAVVGLALSIYNTVNNNVTKNKEILICSNVLEDDYYFDGETLSQEISLIVSNNSQISISIVEIQIFQGGKDVVIVYMDEIQELPINLATNFSIKQKLLINKELSPKQNEMITNEFGSDCYIEPYMLGLLFGELSYYLDENGQTVNLIGNASLNIVLITSMGNEFTYEANGWTYRELKPVLHPQNQPN